MSFSLLSVAILLIFFAIAAIEIWACIKHGFRRSLISFGVAVASLIISALLTRAIAYFITDRLISVVIQNTSLYDRLTNDFHSLVEIILAFSSILVGILIFLIVFFVIRAIFKGIVFHIYKIKTQAAAHRAAYYKEKGSYFDKNDRTLSIIVGVITAVLITMVVTAPLMGLLDVTKSVLDISRKADQVFKNPIDNEIAESIDTYSNDAVGNFFYQFGGKAIFSSIANAPTKTGNVFLLRELEVLEKTAEDFSSVYYLLRNGNNSIVKDTSCLYSLSEDIGQLELFHGLLADFVSNLGASWQNGGAYLSIPKPETNSIIAPAFDNVIEVCANTDTYSVKYNASTLLKIYAIILDSGLIHLNTDNYAEVTDFITNSGIIEQLSAVIAANPYMRHISIESIAMAALSQHIRFNNYDVYNYHILMNNIAESLNAVRTKGYASEEEQIDALCNQAAKHIELYGVHVPDEIARFVAGEIIRSFSMTDYRQITGEDISTLFDSYISYTD